MLPHWVSKYIGLPYKTNGRDASGCDCYGLARLVLAEVFQQDIPDVNPADIERAGKAAVLACEARKDYWAQSPGPAPGCVVSLRVGAFSAHVGVCIGGPMFLHVLEGSAACVESLESPVWRDRVAGFYRWNGGRNG